MRVSSVESQGGSIGALETLRAAPLLRVKAKISVKIAVCMSLRLAAYGEFDSDFGFDSQEWSCSKNPVLSDATPCSGKIYGRRAEEMRI